MDMIFSSWKRCMNLPAEGMNETNLYFRKHHQGYCLWKCSCLIHIFLIFSNRLLHHPLVLCFLVVWIQLLLTHHPHCCILLHHTFLRCFLLVWIRLWLTHHPTCCILLHHPLVLCFFVACIQFLLTHHPLCFIFLFHSFFAGYEKKR